MIILLGMLNSLGARACGFRRLNETIETAAR